MFSQIYIDFLHPSDGRVVIYWLTLVAACLITFSVQFGVTTMPVFLSGELYPGRLSRVKIIDNKRPRSYINQILGHINKVVCLTRRGSRKFRPDAEIFGIFSIEVAPKGTIQNKFKITMNFFDNMTLWLHVDLIRSL